MSKAYEFKLVEPVYERGTSLEDMAKELNELGDDGWSLKAVVGVVEASKEGEEVTLSRVPLPVMVFERVKS